MLPVIDDSCISVEQVDDARYYFNNMQCTNKKKWASVTTLTKWAANKTAMFQQIIAEKPHLAAEWRSRAELGSRVHKALETGDTAHFQKGDDKYFDKYSKYLNNVVVSSPAKEKALLWEGTYNNIPIGFGGKPDAVHYIDYSRLYYADGTPIIDNSTINHLSFSVIDYKTKKENRLNSKPEYGLEHYLQCAANTAALNKSYNCAFAANKSLVLVSTTRKLYIYYLYPHAIEHYWKAFKDIMFHYYMNKTYNWKALEEESAAFWPIRVYLQEETDGTEFI